MATQRSVTPTQPARVVGGTGKTGRRVAERLPARGSEVRIGTRRATGASESLGRLRQLKEVCGVAPLGFLRVL